MNITQQVVRELLDYDPETGCFTWRQRDKSWFRSTNLWKRWNTRYAGKRAGCCLSNKGGYKYRVITLLGRVRTEHRLAWLWMSDEPLPEEVDHENRDGTDNRWENLRRSSSAMNAHNKSRQRSNTSGIAGVSWHKRDSLWQAYCTIKGKRHFLGYYTELDEAAMQVMEFRAYHGFDPHHGLELAPYHREAAA